MFTAHQCSLVVAGLLAQGHRRPSVLILVLGAVIVVLGMLRLFGFLPRLNGRRDLPVVRGVLTILVGAGVVIFALVR